MPSWQTITRVELDAELATDQPDTPNYTTARPLTATEVQGSLDVSWPSPLTKRIMEVRLVAGEEIMGRRRLRGGVWTAFTPLEDHWMIVRASAAMAEPRMMHVTGSVPVHSLVPDGIRCVLLLRVSSGILALGHDGNSPFYAQYS